MKIENVKVGLTVFVGIVIFFIFIFLVGTGGYYFTKTYNLRMFVKDVQGLADGNMVSLGGVKIGSVKEMLFSKSEGEKGVNVILEIKEKYQSQITKSSLAEIKTLGVLGDKFIDIKFGTEGEPVLKENEYISVKSSPSLSDISNQLQPVIDDLSIAVHNIKTVSDSIATGNGILSNLINDDNTAADFKEVISGLKSFTVKLQNPNSSLSKLMNEDSLYDEILPFSSNLNNLSGRITSGKGTLGKIITTDTLYNNLMSISYSLKTIGQKMNSDSSLVGVLLNDEKTKQDFINLINNIDSLSVDLKENPGKYINLSIF